jgi:hypothetical protein
MVTFTDIVKEQRQQGVGVFGSLGKAAGQRTLERIDPRNYLFKRSGLLTSLFPGLKGYQAKGGSSEIKSPGASSSLGQTNLVVDKLDELKVVQQETAKNTLVLPIIARDMNIMRQNILKLVKLSEGKPSSRANSFFMSARDRESAYESRFGKKSTSPTAITPKGDKEEKTGGLGSLLSGLKVIGGALLSAYLLSSKFREMVNGLLNSLFESILGPENWGSIKNSIGDSIRGIKDSVMKSAGIDPQKIDRTIDVVKQGGKAAAVGAGALLANKYVKPIAQTVTRGGIKTTEIGAKTRRGATSIEKSAMKGRLTTIFTKIAKKPSMWKSFLSALAKRFGITFVLKFAAVGIAATGLAVTGVGALVSALLIALNVYTLYEVATFAEEWYNLNKDEEDTSPTPVEKSSDNQIGREADISDTTPSMLVSPNTRAAKGELTNQQEDMANLIREKFKAAGFSDIQAEAAVANAIAESGLNPNAHNTRGEDSVGLFQMNREKGLGVGYSVEQLKDPNKNIDLAIAAAKNSKDFKSASTIDGAVAAFVKDVERPANQASEITKRTQIALNQKPSMQTGMTLASAATAVPSINDIGKFLNQGSTEFESMIREFLKSTGEVTINSDSSTKVSSTSGGQVGTPGSAYDNDFVPRLLVGIA